MVAPVRCDCLTQLSCCQIWRTDVLALRRPVESERVVDFVTMLLELIVTCRFAAVSKCVKFNKVLSSAVTKAATSSTTAPSVCAL